MTANAATPPPRTPIPRPRRKRRVMLWLLLAILVGGVLWVSFGAGPIAREARELVGIKQDHIIVDATFSVGAHTFRYYKFSLPDATMQALVVGFFKSSAESLAAGSAARPAGESGAATSSVGTSGAEMTGAGASNAGTSDDDGTEAYVLTESAFAEWRTGHATSSLYDSGLVSESVVHADIPPGPGTYYLVFSNKSSPTTPKSVHSSVVLRYKSWLPDWLRRRKSGF